MSVLRLKVLNGDGSNRFQSNFKVFGRPTLYLTYYETITRHRFGRIDRRRDAAVSPRTLFNQDIFGGGAQVLVRMVEKTDQARA